MKSTLAYFKKNLNGQTITIFIYGSGLIKHNFSGNSVDHDFNFKRIHVFRFSSNMVDYNYFFVLCSVLLEVIRASLVFLAL